MKINKIISLTLLLFIPFSNPKDEITIRYIGNMGVLISGEKSSILIDALHTEYNKESYLFPPQSLVDSLTNGLGDFPPIKAVAATHYHGDHLDANQVATFLQTNSTALFFGSGQSTDLVKESNSSLEDQIITFDTNTYEKQTIEVGDISVKGFYMNHSNPRHAAVQNVGYLIEIDGQRILHVGDSNWFEEAFTALNLKKEDIDIAIFPFWMLLNDEDQSKLKNWVNPKRIIATHLPPTGFERYTNKIKSNYPEAYSLTILNQVITIQN